MIRIALGFTSDAMEAVSIGHATGDSDQCVAASILMWALAGYAQNLEDDCPGTIKVRILQGSGALYLRIEPVGIPVARFLDDIKTRLKAAFQVVSTGILQLIAYEASKSQIEALGTGHFATLFCPPSPDRPKLNFQRILADWLNEAKIDINKMSSSVSF